MVHVDPQVRGEPGRLALPVADQRHRAHQQRGSGLRGLRGDERQELDRLAQAHVVGQDAAQAQVAQEGEPRKPALLVGPQRPGEARGRRHRRQPPVGLPGQQVAEPAVGVHADQRDLVAGAALGQSEAGQQRVGGRHRARLTALQELQRGLEVRLVQLDPLAAQPDQGGLEPGQLGQLGRVDHLVADGHVVAEVHQVAEPEPGLGDRRAGRGGLGPGGQLEPEPGLAHPVRQQHPEPGPGQQRPGFLQEPERARGVQLQHRRLRLVQRVLQLAEQPGGGAQPGQQLLDRVVAAGPDALARPGVAVPDVGSRDHQARVLGRLQRELHPPRIFLGDRRLGQPEAGPHRAGRDERAVQPRVQLRGQLWRPRLRPAASPRRGEHRCWSVRPRTVRPKECEPEYGRASRAGGNQAGGCAPRRR